MDDDAFKDGSKNSATFKTELFATISNGRVYNQWTVVFACCCSNLTSLEAKLKSNENGHALKVASDMISWFVDMFLHFFENANFCFTNILFHFENQLQK